jgi:hypothetical protein
MALILAIEPDRRQAAQLTNLIRARVNADLVLAETAEQALHAIGDRVPDLVLVPALLAPQDDATLAGALRVIAAAARIQMLTIPVLAATSRKKQPRGVLAKWRRLRAEPAASGGCDPAMFGDQIAAYLAEAAAERAVNESDRAAAAPAEVSMHKGVVPSMGTAPVGEAIGIPAIEGVPLPEIGMAAIDEVVVAEDTAVLTGVFLGVPGHLGDEEPSVDEPQDEPAVETLSIADVPLAQGDGDVGPWATPSFVARQDVESLAAEPLPEPEREAASLVEELPIVEAPIDAGGFVTVQAIGEALPMAVDSISLPPNEDAWDTEEQEEFFLGAFGEELTVDEPAVYELQSDDLSIDLVSFDEPPVDRPQSHSPAMDTVQLDQATQPAQLDQATQPASLELTQPGPRGPWMPLSFGARPMWPDLEGMVAEEVPVAEPVIAEPVRAEELAHTEARVATIQGKELSVETAATTAAAPTAPAAKPEWLELIESLRRDVERLRGQRTQPPPVAAARTKEASTRTAAPVAAVAGPVSVARTPSVVDIVAKTKKRSGSAKPAQDEWGFFDPEQCGFAALLAKLDEITHLNDGV